MGELVNVMLSRFHLHSLRLHAENQTTRNQNSYSINHFLFAIIVLWWNHMQRLTRS
jgi:hypothetical protein